MITMFRATVKRDHIGDVENAVKTLFAAIGQAKPPGVRYASYQLADSSTYVITLELRDESQNPLLGVPGFLAFQEDLKGWLAEPAIMCSAR